MPNYFEFFDLPPAPRVDQAALKKRFLANSRAFHPDFHTLADEATQQRALEQATLNNQGYKILRDDDLRLKHLLEVRGLLAEGSNSQLPQSFLMEMMDLNEARMELEFDDDPAARARVDGMIDELEAGLRTTAAPVLDHYDDATATPADLAALKDYYLKKRYLRRLRQQEPEV